MPGALENIDNVSFTEPYRKDLQPALDALRSAPSYLMLGRCWINLSKFLLELYVPSIPVDPAVIEKCSYRFVSEQRELLEDELTLQREYERRTIGRYENPAIKYLSEMLKLLQPHTPDEENSIPPRTDVARLHAYWTEISQFKEQVISSQKIDAIVSALVTRESSAQMREQVFQESTAAFSKRLDIAYGDYADINGPIQLALLQMRLGLRLVADSTATDVAASQSEATTVTALTAFPCSIGSAQIPDPSPGQPSNSTFPTVLWRLGTTIMEAEWGAEVATYMPRVEAFYEQSLGLWLVDKARKEEAERQSQSLYRHKTESNVPATEAELEEQDFLSLFPEYEDLLQQDPPARADVSPHKPKDLIDTLDVKRLSSLHQRLFRPASPPSAADPLDVRGDILRDILTATVASLPERLDQLSRPYQITSLLSRLSILHAASRDKHKPFNFYLDSNVPEIRKSSEVLERMSSRLISLIEEWPDQMVLQHLKARCDAVLALDGFSPIAKGLSAIEQLLLQMEDWEMYANKENTLKSYQHDLVNLVVSWRRLELTSWQGLLHTQAQDFADGSSEWWFQLYEATVRGVASAAREENSGESGAVARYLEGLVPLLDSFVTSCPLGQFVTRLHHLHSFETYCHRLSIVQDFPQADASRRAHRILYFTRAYYSQFASRVTASIGAQQQALEKEIRDFIKLASWKDINVHALKQSAQRTHRQLYKCVRKFREILRQPVTPHLVPDPAGSEESTSIIDALPFNIPSNVPPLPPFTYSDSYPDHLVHLDRTLKNFQSVLRGRIGAIVGVFSPSDIEELSVEIITTMQNLASAVPPAAATQEQKEKFFKSILVRKRKAWSDLLKELKRIGLSVNMKPEVLEQQSNSRWIREQPIVEVSVHTQGPFEKSEKYLLRLTKLLPDLRAALVGHHDDIGLRDLQRGTNLVESAFSLAVETRAW